MRSVRKLMTMANVHSQTLYPYADNLITCFGSSLIGYWKLGETGGTATVDSSGNSRNGVYTDTILNQNGIGDGYKSAYFGASTSKSNIYSTSLRDAFNKDEGTLLVWVKIPQTSWDISGDKYVIQIATNGNNYVSIYKNATDRISFVYRVNSVSKSIVLTGTGIVNTNWIPLAITWSKSNDRVIAYRKGFQASPTVAIGSDSWSGTLYQLYCGIGRNMVDNATPLIGYEAHVALLNREATPAEIFASSYVSSPGGTQTSWIIPQGGGVPAVMFTFDDEYESIYTEAYSYMHSKGVRGTFYVMTNAIDGNNTPPFVTHQELQEMDAAGWSIANHTTDQTDLTTLSRVDAAAKISGAKTVLDGLGLTKASMHLSYPGGNVNTTVVLAAQDAGILTGRRVYTSPEGWPDYVSADNYLIWSTLRLGSGESIGYAMSLVDRAVAENKTLLVYGHKIVDPAVDSTNWEPWRLKALVDYCIQKNLPFLTINDYYALQSGPLTITRS